MSAAQVRAGARTTRAGLYRLVFTGIPAEPGQRQTSGRPWLSLAPAGTGRAGADSQPRCFVASGGRWLPPQVSMLCALACITEKNKGKLNRTNEESLSSPRFALLFIFTSSRAARCTGGFQFSFVFKGKMSAWSLQERPPRRAAFCGPCSGCGWGGSGVFAYLLMCLVISRL